MQALPLKMCDFLLSCHHMEGQPLELTVKAAVIARLPVGSTNERVQAITKKFVEYISCMYSDLDCPEIREIFAVLGSRYHIVLKFRGDQERISLIFPYSIT